MQHSLFVVVKKNRRQNITKSKGDSLFCNLQANPIFFSYQMKGDLSGPVYRGVGLALGSNQHQKYYYY